MNIHSYYISSVFTLLLCSCVITQPMQQSSLTSKEKATIGVVIVGFLVTTYGFYRFLHWLNTPQAQQGSHSSSQRIKGINTNSDLKIRQNSDSDEKSNFNISRINNIISHDQSGGGRINHHKNPENRGLDELLIDRLNTQITTITATGIGKLLLYQAQSPNIRLSLECNADFSLVLKDSTLSCNFGSYSNQKPVLQVWMPNTNNIKLDLRESVEASFAK